MGGIILSTRFLSSIPSLSCHPFFDNDTIETLLIRAAPGDSDMSLHVHFLTALFSFSFFFFFLISAPDMLLPSRR